MLGAEIAKAIPQAGACRTTARAALEQPRRRWKSATCAAAICSTMFRFSFIAGEVLGVAALEGQGQEELFDCIAGVRRFDDGAILAQGKASEAAPSRRRDRRRPGAGARQSSAGAAAAALDSRERRAADVAPLCRTGGRSRCAPSATRVESAVQRLQIDTRAESELRRLSGGNQQKVVIARWLASGFKTLLCFDPTRGIDIGTKQPDLCAGARTGGGGLGGAAVHVGTAGNSAGLRSRHRPVRRAGRRTKCRRPRPTRRRCCAPRMGLRRQG